jgi:hypothetical protein
MKTLKTFKNERLFRSVLLLLFFSINFTIRAEDKFSKNFANDLVKDGFIGYYIIGGILAFGIIGYLIISLVRKHEKTSGTNHTTHKHHHHRHHHHRNIKKLT